MTKQAFKLKRLPGPSSLTNKAWWFGCSRLGLSLLALSPALPRLSADDNLDASMIAHVQTAQFKIPFNVESRGVEPLKVQLWVSADDGATWQTYGSVPSDAKAFDFRAAAEGTYLFKVATIDAAGTTYPNLGAPLKVLVDTTKPRAEIKADIDGSGHLVVDVKVQDEHLDLRSAVLRLRSDQESQWRDLPFELRGSGDSVYSGQVITDLAPCREVAIVFIVKDRSLNEGEAACQYTMPRTASGQRDVTLASSHNPTVPTEAATRQTAPPVSGPRLTSTPGAARWNPTATPTAGTPTSTSPAGTTSTGATSTAATTTGATSTSPTAAVGTPPASTVAVKPPLSPGRLASNGQLSLDPPVGQSEELPLPPALSVNPPLAAEPRQKLTTKPQTEKPLTEKSLTEKPLNTGASNGPGFAESSSRDKPTSAAALKEAQTPDAPEASTIGRAFHCKSRAFSLDYSVEALGGSALADVELWGTEDGGREWQKWGSDPDRLSPFDVQVGNDGLFGFRMVVVGTNGIVSNRPREGDSADVWINVDTSLPTVKITRAVYGEGPEDGLLVIDYNCVDGHLVDRPIALSYSERADGPWTEIATGLANTGLYLWKAAPNMPDKIYLKIDCVDKAGNIGTHRLDLPIDIRGLAPRGIIQGFRPIEVPAK